MLTPNNLFPAFNATMVSRKIPFLVVDSEYLSKSSAKSPLLLKLNISRCSTGSIRFLESKSRSKP